MTTRQVVVQNQEPNSSTRQASKLTGILYQTVDLRARFSSLLIARHGASLVIQDTLISVIGDRRRSF